MAIDTESGVPQDAQDWKAPDDSKKLEETKVGPEKETQIPTEADIQQKVQQLMNIREQASYGGAGGELEGD